MASTVSSLITKIQTRLNETNTTFHTSANLIAAVDEAQKYIVREAEILLQGSSTTTTVANTQNYTLPSDFLYFARLTYDGFKLFQVNFNEIDEAEFDETLDVGLPTNYYIFNDQFYLYPTPNQAKTLKLWYYKAPTALTATSDSLEINSIIDDIVATYAAYLACIKDDSLLKADYLMQECNAKLLSYKRKIKENKVENPKFRLSRNLKTRQPLDNGYYRE